MDNFVDNISALADMQSLPPTTEDALASEFADMHARELRYCAAWSRWMRFDGSRWRHEETLLAFDLARNVCRKAALTFNKHAITTAGTIAAVERIARSDRRIAATVDQWDRDKLLLNTINGTVDLRTGATRPADSADYITKAATVTPGGECPLWLSFLDRVTGQDDELQAFLKRVCGYALTGSTTEDALFFLYGTGANGKSVFIRTIADILGDYHESAPAEMFMIAQNDRHPTDLAMLRGARLVTVSELAEGKRWDEAKIKQLTGGDRVKARFMRQDFFEYVPQFKLLIAGNHRPAIRTVDEAIRRRMNLIPFTVTIPKEERDPDLSQKLKAEAPGILRWMVDGCLEWQQTGLRPPKAVTSATDDYLESQDAVRLFIEECCETGHTLHDTADNLFAGWKVWAEANGQFVGTKQRFGDRLVDKGYQRMKLSGARRHTGLIFVGDAAKIS